MASFAPRPLAAACSFAFAVVLTQAQGAVVVDALPYQGVPGWSDVVFSGTSMGLVSDPSQPLAVVSNLVTAQGRGVWFGWANYVGNQPAWTPGSATEGNYLRLDASFSAGAADWSAYFYDRTYMASMLFAPTGCEDNCYGRPGEAGVRVYFSDPADSSRATNTFVPLDLTSNHTYEVLLKDGWVTYHVDGAVVASAQAFRSDRGSPLVVIGDGSGSTRSGEGVMSIRRAVWDNAPTFDTVPGQTMGNARDHLNPFGTTLQVGGLLRNLGGAAFTNAGQLDILPGGAFVNLLGGTFHHGGAIGLLGGASFTNLGMFQGLAGASIQNSGLFTNASGATFRHAGTFDNLPAAVLGGLGGRALNAGVWENESGGVFANAGLFTNDASGIVRNAGLLGGAFGGAFANSGRVENLSGGTLRNAGTFDNLSGILGGLGGRLVNDGLIENELGGVFGNAGTVTNSASGIVRNAGLLGGAFGGAFANSGRIENLSGGTLRNAGTFDNLAGLLGGLGGRLVNDGLIENEVGGAFGNAGRIENRAGAEFRNAGLLGGLLGSTFVNGGRFENRIGATFDNGGTFTNLQGALAVLGGSVFNTSDRTLVNEGELEVSGVLTNTATGVLRNSGSLTITTTGRLVNEGGLENTGTITNAGEIRTAKGADLHGTGSFIQSSGLARIDGPMSAGAFHFKGGQVAGTGVVQSPTTVIIGADARLDPGANGEDGLPEIVADVDLAGDLVIWLEGDATLPGGRLSMATGVLRLFDTSDIFVTLASLPTTAFEFLVVDALAVEGLDRVQLHVTGAGGRAYAFENRDGDLVLTLSAPVNPVPEPSEVALLVLGLALVGVKMRRPRG